MTNTKSEAVNVATVASIIDEYKVVINRGKDHGLNEGDRFLVYELTEEIKDPDTGISLGRLEVTKGTGKVIHLQEKMAIIESNRKIELGSPFSRGFSFKEVHEPFDNPKIGDKAKKIVTITKVGAT